MKYTFNTFYKQYIPEAKIEEVMEYLSDDEKYKALEYTQKIMNYTVWQLICQLLQPQEYDSFFALQQSNFVDESLIDWLEERYPEIRMLLPEALERSMVAIIADLQEIGEYDHS